MIKEYMSSEGFIIEITNNGIYIVRTDDYIVYEAFPDRKTMLKFLDYMFDDIEKYKFSNEKKPKNKQPPKEDSGRISTKN